MGISGLLPLLKDITKPVPFSSLRHQTICIDGYFLLHRMTQRSINDLALSTKNPFNTNTDPAWIQGIIEILNKLSLLCIDVIVVFDGMKTYGKKVEGDRQNQREKRWGQGYAALQQYIHQCIGVTKGIDSNDFKFTQFPEMTQFEHKDAKKKLDAKLNGCIDVDFNMALQLINVIGDKFNQKFHSFQFLPSDDDTQQNEINNFDTFNNINDVSHQYDNIHSLPLFMSNTPTTNTNNNQTNTSNNQDNIRLDNHDKNTKSTQPNTRFTPPNTNLQNKNIHSSQPLSISSQQYKTHPFPKHPPISRPHTFPLKQSHDQNDDMYQKDNLSLSELGTVDWLIAPYEADSQLVYLVRSGICHAALAEDSDLIALGCERLLTKPDFSDRFMDARMISLDDVLHHKSSPFIGMSLSQLQYCSIIAGCDYTKGVYGLGMAKAIKLVNARRCLCNLVENNTWTIGSNEKKSILNPAQPVPVVVGDLDKLNKSIDCNDFVQQSEFSYTKYNNLDTTFTAASIGNIDIKIKRANIKSKCRILSTLNERINIFLNELSQFKSHNNTDSHVDGHDHQDINTMTHGDTNAKIGLMDNDGNTNNQSNLQNSIEQTSNFLSSLYKISSNLEDYLINVDKNYPMTSFSRSKTLNKYKHLKHLVSLLEQHPNIPTTSNKTNTNNNNKSTKKNNIQTNNFNNPNNNHYNNYDNPKPTKLFNPTTPQLIGGDFHIHTAVSNHYNPIERREELLYAVLMFNYQYIYQLNIIDYSNNNQNIHQDQHHHPLNQNISLNTRIDKQGRTRLHRKHHVYLTMTHLNPLPPQLLLSYYIPTYIPSRVVSKMTLLPFSQINPNLVKTDLPEVKINSFDLCVNDNNNNNVGNHHKNITISPNIDDNDSSNHIQSQLTLTIWPPRLDNSFSTNKDISNTDRSHSKMQFASSLVLMRAFLEIYKELTTSKKQLPLVVLPQLYVSHVNILDHYRNYVDAGKSVLFSRYSIHFLHFVIKSFIKNIILLSKLSSIRIPDVLTAKSTQANQISADCEPNTSMKHDIELVTWDGKTIHNGDDVLTKFFKTKQIKAIVMNMMPKVFEFLLLHGYTYVESCTRADDATMITPNQFDYIKLITDLFDFLTKSTHLYNCPNNTNEASTISTDSNNNIMKHTFFAFISSHFSHLPSQLLSYDLTLHAWPCLFGSNGGARPVREELWEEMCLEKSQHLNPRNNDFESHSNVEPNFVNPFFPHFSRLNLHHPNSIEPNIDMSSFSQFNHSLNHNAVPNATNNTASSIHIHKNTQADSIKQVQPTQTSFFYFLHSFSLPPPLSQFYCDILVKYIELLMKEYPYVVQINNACMTKDSSQRDFNSSSIDIHQIPLVNKSTSNQQDRVKPSPLLPQTALPSVPSTKTNNNQSLASHTNLLPSTISPSFYTHTVLDTTHPTDELWYSQLSYLFSKMDDFLSPQIPSILSLLQSICPCCVTKQSKLPLSPNHSLSNMNTRSSYQIGNSNNPNDTSFNPKSPNLFNSPSHNSKTIDLISPHDGEIGQVSELFVPYQILLPMSVLNTLPHSLIMSTPYDTDFDPIRSPGSSQIFEQSPQTQNNPISNPIFHDTSYIGTDADMDNRIDDDLQGHESENYRQIAIIDITTPTMLSPQGSNSLISNHTSTHPSQQNALLSSFHHDNIIRSPTQFISTSCSYSQHSLNRSTNSLTNTTTRNTSQNNLRNSTVDSYVSHIDGEHSTNMPTGTIIRTNNSNKNPPNRSLKMIPPQIAHNRTSTVNQTTNVAFIDDFEDHFATQTTSDDYDRVEGSNQLNPTFTSPHNTDQDDYNDMNIVSSPTVVIQSGLDQLPDPLQHSVSQFNQQQKTASITITTNDNDDDLFQEPTTNDYDLNQKNITSHHSSFDKPSDNDRTYAKSASHNRKGNDTNVRINDTDIILHIDMDDSLPISSSPKDDFRYLDDDIVPDNGMDSANIVGDDNDDDDLTFADEHDTKANSVFNSMNNNNFSPDIHQAPLQTHVSTPRDRFIYNQYSYQYFRTNQVPNNVCATDLPVNMIDTPQIDNNDVSQSGKLNSNDVNLDTIDDIEIPLPNVIDDDSTLTSPPQSRQYQYNLKISSPVPVHSPLVPSGTPSGLGNRSNGQITVVTMLPNLDSSLTLIAPLIGIPHLQTHSQTALLGIVPIDEVRDYLKTSRALWSRLHAKQKKQFNSFYHQEEIQQECYKDIYSRDMSKCLDELVNNLALNGLSSWHNHNDFINPNNDQSNHTVQINTKPTMTGDNNNKSNHNPNTNATCDGTTLTDSTPHSKNDTSMSDLINKNHNKALPAQKSTKKSNIASPLQGFYQVSSKSFGSSDGWQENKLGTRNRIRKELDLLPKKSKKTTKKSPTRSSQKASKSSPGQIINDHHINNNDHGEIKDNAFMNLLQHVDDTNDQSNIPKSTTIDSNLPKQARHFYTFQPFKHLSKYDCYNVFQKMLQSIHIHKTLYTHLSHPFDNFNSLTVIDVIKLAYKQRAMRIKKHKDVSTDNPEQYPQTIKKQPGSTLHGFVKVNSHEKQQQQQLQQPSTLINDVVSDQLSGDVEIPDLSQHSITPAKCILCRDARYVLNVSYSIQTDYFPLPSHMNQLSFDKSRDDFVRKIDTIHKKVSTPSDLTCSTPSGSNNTIFDHGTHTLGPLSSHLTSRKIHYPVDKNVFLNNFNMIISKEPCKCLVEEYYLAVSDNSVRNGIKQRITNTIKFTKQLNRKNNNNDNTISTIDFASSSPLLMNSNNDTDSVMCPDNNGILPELNPSHIFDLVGISSDNIISLLNSMTSSPNHQGRTGEYIISAIHDTNKFNTTPNNYTNNNNNNNNKPRRTSHNNFNSNILPRPNTPQSHQTNKGTLYNHENSNSNDKIVKITEDLRLLPLSHITFPLLPDGSESHLLLCNSLGLCDVGYDYSNYLDCSGDDKCDNHNERLSTMNNKISNTHNDNKTNSKSNNSNNDQSGTNQAISSTILDNINKVIETSHRLKLSTKMFLFSTNYHLTAILSPFLHPLYQLPIQFYFSHAISTNRSINDQPGSQFYMQFPFKMFKFKLNNITNTTSWSNYDTNISRPQLDQYNDEIDSIDHYGNTTPYKNNVNSGNKTGLQTPQSIRQEKKAQELLSRSTNPLLSKTKFTNNNSNNNNSPFNNNQNSTNNNINNGTMIGVKNNNIFNNKSTDIYNEYSLASDCDVDSIHMSDLSHKLEKNACEKSDNTNTINNKEQLFHTTSFSVQSIHLSGTNGNVGGIRHDQMDNKSCVNVNNHEDNNHKNHTYQPQHSDPFASPTTTTTATAASVAAVPTAAATMSHDDGDSHTNNDGVSIIPKHYNNQNTLAKNSSFMSPRQSNNPFQTPKRTSGTYFKKSIVMTDQKVQHHRIVTNVNHNDNDDDEVDDNDGDDDINMDGNNNKNTNDNKNITNNDSNNNNMSTVGAKLTMSSVLNNKNTKANNVTNSDTNYYDDEILLFDDEYHDEDHTNRTSNPQTLNNKHENMIKDKSGLQNQLEELADLLSDSDDDNGDNVNNHKIKSNNGHASVQNSSRKSISNKSTLLSPISSFAKSSHENTFGSNKRTTNNQGQQNDARVDIVNINIQHETQSSNQTTKVTNIITETAIQSTHEQSTKPSFSKQLEEIDKLWNETIKNTTSQQSQEQHNNTSDPIPLSNENRNNNNDNDKTYPNCKSTKDTKTGHQRTPAMFYGMNNPQRGISDGRTNPFAMFRKGVPGVRNFNPFQTDVKTTTHTRSITSNHNETRNNISTCQSTNKDNTLIQNTNNDNDQNGHNVKLSNHDNCNEVLDQENNLSSLNQDNKDVESTDKDKINLVSKVECDENVKQGNESRRTLSISHNNNSRLSHLSISHRDSIRFSNLSSQTSLSTQNRSSKTANDTNSNNGCDDKNDEKKNNNNTNNTAPPSFFGITTKPNGGTKLFDFNQYKRSNAFNGLVSNRVQPTSGLVRKMPFPLSTSSGAKLQLASSSSSSTQAPAALTIPITPKITQIDQPLHTRDSQCDDSINHNNKRQRLNNDQEDDKKR